MFSRDVRDEKRCADEKPSDIAARQKVLLGRALPSREVQPDSEDNGEVNSDNDEVQSSNSLVSRSDIRCKQHPFLLGVLRHFRIASVARMTASSLTGFTQYSLARSGSGHEFLLSFAPRLSGAQSITGSGNAQWVNGAQRLPALALARLILALPCWRIAR